MSLRRRLAAVTFYIVLTAFSLLLLYAVLVARNQAQRGVWLPGNPLPSTGEIATPLGTTVELTQYDNGALDAALDEAEAMGLGLLRQELRWDTVEPEPGEREWERYDRVIEAAASRGFQLILFLNRTPPWARKNGEEANPFAPPRETSMFAEFAREAATRYGEHVYGWQVWDEPNLMPHWGTEVIIDPDEYAAFLADVAPAIRAADPDAVIATAGLGPTVEPGGFNMSEVTYLRWLYDTGANQYFDAVALKPFGFWREVAERVYGEEHLGLDRVVLVRELMERRGDSTKPVWFVEGGWAVLPPDWTGELPPWGYDSPATQQRRLYETVRRTVLEWPWTEVIALQLLQPDAPPDDPRWSLSLLDPEGERTALGERMAYIGNAFLNGQVGEVERARWELLERPALRHYDYAALGLGLLLLVLTARLGWHSRALPWNSWREAFLRQPEWLQMTLVASTTLGFYLVDNRVVALLIYALLGLLITWRYDLGLAAVAFAIPFYLQTKAFASLHFSMVELLLFLCAFVWLLRGVKTRSLQGRSLLRNSLPSPLIAQRYDHAALRSRLASMFWPRDMLDWSVIVLVLWAGLSVLFAQRFGVAAREFRVVVLEAAVWYWLIRRSELEAEGRRRVIDALLISTLIVALYGLYQWLFTGEVIRAEGVERIRGVYGSPNNLALLLERVLPVSLAVLLLAPPSARRRLYGLAAGPLALVLFFTFSRGAWLLGMPAALLWLAWWSDQHVRRSIAAVVLVGGFALLPFAATERLSTLVTLESGTWAIRLSLWQSTIEMLRDFPFFGVGLDNFLYAYDVYRLPEAWREPNLSHPHQIFLHFWVALGIPGLFLLIWQQLAFWRAWLRANARVGPRTVARALLVGLGASMCATIAHGLIDNSFFLVDLAFIWMMTLSITAQLEEA